VVGERFRKEVRRCPTMSSPRSGPAGRDDLHELIGSVFAELRVIRDLLQDRRKPFFTVHELAKLFGRSGYTVRTWIKAGRLRATRVSGTGPRGRLLVPLAEVDRLVAAGRATNTPACGLTGAAELAPINAIDRPCGQGEA
jgi:excisionase family DNA binding protein